MSEFSSDELIVFRGADGDWYWHRRDPANHEVVSHGEGYTRKEGAVTGARRANPDITDVQVTG